MPAFCDGVPASLLFSIIILSSIVKVSVLRVVVVPETVRFPVIVTTLAVKVPVNVGSAKLAFKALAVVTNSVVAICVVLAAAVAVGAVGVPVSAGEAKSAYPAALTQAEPLHFRRSPEVAVVIVTSPISSRLLIVGIDAHSRPDVAVEFAFK